ncbi:GNAT family N-acetyltransferase [Hoeflea sp.]|uniref:GNAT family N-acetyltransferase n=1 Tax=Hoeflea sp. TaxID=1940281 RepID=UPI003B52D509
MSEPRGIASRAAYRPSTETDLEAIRHIEALSYHGAGDGLSKRLLDGPERTLSFVAEIGSLVVGHVLLTRIEGPERALALAPLAILPDWRDMQIGTSLVRHALTAARNDGWNAVFAYGLPDYYCRFGFRSDLADPAATVFQGPRFLALELHQGALDGWSGPLDFPAGYRTISDAIHR